MASMKSTTDDSLRTAINRKRRFAFFGPSRCGCECERWMFIDALEDACSCSVPAKKQTPFPESQLTPSIEAIINSAVTPNRNYISCHSGLCDSIQSEILSWVKEVDETLSSGNPFEEEEQFLRSLESQSPADVVNNLDGIQKKFSQGNINFDFYRKEWDASSGDEEKAADISSALLEEMAGNLQNRKLQWELQEIDRMRSAFIKELKKRLRNYKRIENTLSSFCDGSGDLWGLAKGFFKKSGFEILSKYAKLLENDKGLQKLADLIGKQSILQKEYETELRSKVVITTSYHPKPAYKGQVCGIKTSNDISSALPSELALFHNPATKKLFELKFSQNQLLSFKYENNTPVGMDGTTQEEVSKEKTDQKGPIIICVDTSGSMQGTPEKIAKTITFALMKTARKEHRKCYLISFSTEIETMSLSGDSGNLEKEMDNLIQFLMMSFNGGTDAYPALEHALEMLGKEEYRNADVLMISDFIMGELDENLVQRIEQEKEKNTDFYSLVIGASQFEDVISVFNKNWCYDTSGDNPEGILVEIPAMIK